MGVGLALWAGREQDMSKKVIEKARIVSLSLNLARHLHPAGPEGQPYQTFSDAL